MASSAHLRAAGDFSLSNYDAIQQSMIAEFALAYQDSATALHNYTVLAIKSNSTTIKQRALNIALEQNDLHAALDIATHWVVQSPPMFQPYFICRTLHSKHMNMSSRAETLDKILNIDANTD